MDVQRARELVADERERIEAALRGLVGEVRSEGLLERQQTGESDPGSELATEMVATALITELNVELAAVERAEARIATGTYGSSIDSGRAIPDARLDAEPLAERTVDEQRRFESGDAT